MPLTRCSQNWIRLKIFIPSISEFFSLICNLPKIRRYHGNFHRKLQKLWLQLIFVPHLIRYYCVILLNTCIHEIFFTSKKFLEVFIMDLSCLYWNMIFFCSKESNFIWTNFIRRKGVTQNVLSLGGFFVINQERAITWNFKQSSLDLFRVINERIERTNKRRMTSTFI